MPIACTEPGSACVLIISSVCHMRRRIHVCHMRRRIHANSVHRAW